MLSDTEPMTARERTLIERVTELENEQNRITQRVYDRLDRLESRVDSVLGAEPKVLEGRLPR